MFVRVSMRAPRYNEVSPWPIMKSIVGDVSLAADFYGDIQCPFCGSLLACEGAYIKIGNICDKCEAKIIRFEENM